MKLKKLSGLLSAVLAGAMVLSMAPAAFAAATSVECEHIQQVAVDNGDGTCSYICINCQAIIDTTAHVWDKDGTCVRCDAKNTATDTSDCNHTGNHWTFEDNHNGTHNVVCADCKTVVSENVACTYEDGVCITCGAKQQSECNHTGNHWIFEDNHNGTHNVVCADCKTVVSENVACTYEDGVCITCGATKPEEVGTTYTVIDATHHHVHAVYEDGTVYDADVPCVFETGTCVCGNTCPHSTFKYENNGNGTHKVICAECGAVVTEATECVYGEDGKGTCACGAKYACDHMGNHWTYVKNGNSTHNVVCADCGAVVSANVACNYENGVCITCGAKQSECNHMGNHWKYVKNGNGTHNVVCADCGAVVSANVACNYENGVCITCGAKQPAAPKPGHGTIDPNFGVGYHPICEFFRAVFRFLFGRH